MKRIAVIGATGLVGRPVTAALAEAGFEVTALARDPDKARRAVPDAVAVVQADASDEDSLRRGLAGQEGLLLSLSVAPGARKGDFHTEAQGLQHILSAARASGIARIGYVSALIRDAEDGDWWVREVWRRAIDRIKASGIPYTVFYPSNLMETLQRHRMGGVFVLAGASPYPNYWIAGRDFGAQVARAFALPQAANREYVIQGPEPMTYAEAARRFASALPERPRIVRVPLAALRALGIFSPAMRYDARMLRTVLGYYEEFRAADTWAELGRPTTTIEEFARHCGKQPI